MSAYEVYKAKVEKSYNKPLVEVIKELYVNKDLGPSVGAKQLGIPRRAFIYFVNLYELKALKFQDYKKKMMISMNNQLFS